MRRKIHFFGQALKDERTRAGKTLKETAAALGVSESSLSRVENGESAPPREEMIIRAAEFFGIRPDELIYAAVRQREGLHAVLAAGTVEAYGRLLEHFHHLDPGQVEEIDAILLRPSRRQTSSKASAPSTRSATRRRGKPNAPTINDCPRTETITDETEQQDTRRMRNGRSASAGAHPQSAARIRHSPRSDLKEESHEKETVVH